MLTEKAYCRGCQTKTKIKLLRILKVLCLSRLELLLFYPLLNNLISTNSSREAFPVSHTKWKTLDVHCDSSQSIWQSAVSRSDGSKLPELSFNRLQLSDQECIGLQKRNFGMFVAREAVLDEEYWVGIALSCTVSFEDLCFVVHLLFGSTAYFLVLHIPDSSMAASRSSLGVFIIYEVNSFLLI